MKKKSKLLSTTLAASAAMLFAHGAAAQELIPVEPLQDLNLVGLGVFSVPDWYGSEDYEAALAPLVHYNFDDTRYIQLIGPEARVNLVPRKDLRAGPLLRFRTRRDDDVDDEVVGRMRPVATATEIGAFAAYHMPLDPNRPMNKVVFTGDIVYNTTGVYSGATGNVRATYYHPFEQAVAGYQLLGTIGFGLFFASDHFMNKYFGVTGSDVDLFPELGGREYEAEAGLASIKIPFTLSARVDPKWLVTIAGRYERLVEDAEDSPLIKERGDENQWVIGIAASYLF